MSCIIQDGHCHTAPELDFFGDLIFPFSISRRFMGSTNSRVLASPSRELLPTYPTVHSSTVYWTGTLMVVEDDGTPNCGIWYAGIMSFISALPLVKIMKGLGRLRIDTSVRGGVSREDQWSSLWSAEAWNWLELGGRVGCT